MEKHENSPLCDKYRPQTLDEVIGHDSVVQTLNGYVTSGKFPSAIAFFGPTSSGKTTLAQALATTVIGSPAMKSRDYTEINGSEARTIEDVRAMIPISKLSPSQGNRRFLMLDEAQGILSNSVAAKALLTPIERPPRTTTWILCSMDPDKFATSNDGRAIANRCVQFHLKPPGEDELARLFTRIRKGEGITYLTNAIRDALIENCNNEMRTLCNLIQSVMGYYEGIPKKDRPEKLDADDVVQHVIKAVQNTDDAVAVEYLNAILENRLQAAVVATLNVTNTFEFLTKLLYIVGFLSANAALSGQRHPKVWASKPALTVLKGEPCKSLGKRSLLVFMLINRVLLDARYKLTTVSAPEQNMMLGLTGQLLSELQPIFKQ